MEAPEALAQHEQQIKNPYSCQFCLRMFETQVEVENHITTHLEPACNLCLKSLENSKSARHRICATCKNRLAKNRGGYADECFLCYQKFPTFEDVLQHKKEFHKIVRPLSCPICKSTSGTNVAFGQHLEAHPSGNFFYCVWCKEFVRSQLALRMHVRNHSIGKFCCPKCDETFFSEMAKQKHVLHFHAEAQRQ